MSLPMVMETAEVNAGVSRPFAVRDLMRSLLDFFYHCRKNHVMAPRALIQRSGESKIQVVRHGDA